MGEGARRAGEGDKSALDVPVRPRQADGNTVRNSLPWLNESAWASHQVSEPERAPANGLSGHRSTGEK